MWITTKIVFWLREPTLDGASIELEDDDGSRLSIEKSDSTNQFSIEEIYTEDVRDDAL